MSSARVRVSIPREQMKFYRKKADLSQHDLAVEIGCTANHIRFLERGYVDPSVQIANLICNKLGADVYTIFPDIFTKETEK